MNLAIPLNCNGSKSLCTPSLRMNTYEDIWGSFLFVFKIGIFIRVKNKLYIW